VKTRRLLWYRLVVGRLWTERNGVVGSFVRGAGEERRVAALVVGIDIRIGTAVLCIRHQTWPIQAWEAITD
jgi:hypothetical protein